jgi:hypothetical protein
MNGMKNWISIVIAFMLSSGLTVKAQELVAALQAETTVAGPQYGGTLAFELKNRIGIGAMWQTELSKGSDATISHRLYGGYIQLPIAKSEKLALLANLRVGLSDEKYLVVIPGLETRLSITKRTGIAFGMGMRMNYPAVSGKIYTTIF